MGIFYGFAVACAMPVGRAHRFVRVAATWSPSFLGLAVGLILVGVWVHCTADSAAYMRFLHRKPLLPEAVWANFSLLGFGWILLIFPGVFERSGGRATLAGALALVAGGVCVQVVKAIFHVARPALAMRLSDISVIGMPVVHSGSMPSGHAAAAGAAATLMWLLFKKRGALTRWRLAAIVVLFGMVAWSRVSVGAHWPADVMVGSGLGMLCGALSWQLAGRLLARTRPADAAGGAGVIRMRKRWLWLCAADLLAAAFCLGENTGYSQVVALQLSLGVLAMVSAMLRLRQWWHAGRHP